MKFAFGMPHMALLKASMQPWEMIVTGADQTRLAKAAEDLGYDMLAVPEHFVVPRSHLELSGPHYFHAYAGMGYLLGATSKIRVNSCIAILPLQHPTITAKALSTIDWMSSGRVTVTFGVGWDKEEFDLLGVPFSERGAIADEYVAAIIELWTKEKPAFDGKYVSFKDIAFEPKPFQKPHLPIWFGGDADPVLKRAAKFASGWMPFLTKADKIKERIAFIKSQATYDGRPFEVMYGLGTARVGEGHVVVDDPKARAGQSAQELIDRINQFREWGITTTSVPIPPVSSIDAYLDYSRWVMEEIKPKVS